MNRASLDCWIVYRELAQPWYHSVVWNELEDSAELTVVISLWFQLQNYEMIENSSNAMEKVITFWKESLCLRWFM